MKISLSSVVAVSLAALGIGFAVSAMGAKAAGKKELVQWSLADLKWKDVPNTPGLQQVDAYKKGGHAVLVHQISEGNRSSDAHPYQ
jgi:hypothetical protein